LSEPVSAVMARSSPASLSLQRSRASPKSPSRRVARSADSCVLRVARRRTRGWRGGGGRGGGEGESDRVRTKRLSGLTSLWSSGGSRACRNSSARQSCAAHASAVARRGCQPAASAEPVSRRGPRRVFGRVRTSLASEDVAHGPPLADLQEEHRRVRREVRAEERHDVRVRADAPQDRDLAEEVLSCLQVLHQIEVAPRRLGGDESAPLQLRAVHDTHAARPQRLQTLPVLVADAQEDGVAVHVPALALSCFSERLYLILELDPAVRQADRALAPRERAVARHGARD